MVKGTKGMKNNVVIASLSTYHSPVEHEVSFGDLQRVKDGKPIPHCVVDYDLTRAACEFWESSSSTANDVVVGPSSTWTLWTNSNGKSTQTGIPSILSYPFIALPIFISGSHWGLLIILYLADVLEATAIPESGPRTAFIFFDSMPQLRKASQVGQQAHKLASHLLAGRFQRNDALKLANWHKPAAPRIESVDIHDSGIFPGIILRTILSDFGPWVNRCTTHNGKDKCTVAMWETLYFDRIYLQRTLESGFKLTRSGMLMDETVRLTREVRKRKAAAAGGDGKHKKRVVLQEANS